MKRNNKRTKLNDQRVYDIKQIEKYLYQINGMKHRTIVPNRNTMIF